MSTRAKCAISFGIGLLVGCLLVAVGAYVYICGLARDLGQSPFLSASSRGIQDISVLRKLRDGDTEGAIHIADQDLTADALSLLLYAGAYPVKDRDPAVCRAAAAIRAYRIAYPDQATGEELTRTLQLGLAFDCSN